MRVCLLSCYSVSESLWSYGLWSTRLLCEKAEWMKVAQSCPTPYNPMDNTAHGTLQARILEWVSLSLLQGIFPTQGSNPSPTLQADSLPTELWGKPMRKQRFRAFKHPAQDHVAILFQFYLFIFCSVISHHGCVQASHCRDFSCCRVWALGYVGPSWTSDGIHVPCNGR